MEKEYEKSMEALQLYIKVTNSIPSEMQWNNYAIQERLLSSKSLEYYSCMKFNKLCRKIMKRKGNLLWIMRKDSKLKKLIKQ